tara:strand:- start:635 stop:2554 length:1920 start_codon:yes stop_codon:yes gene_type:complete
VNYKHWTKIDDGAEGAWAADIWLKVLKIIYRHTGENVYDDKSDIYLSLEKEVPELSWRTFENEKFRPYFRDFSKPWSLTGVASFNGTFEVSLEGEKLAKGLIKEPEFWIRFLSSYEEEGEKPFAELAYAFLLTPEAISLEEVYWGIVRGFRQKYDSRPDYNITVNEQIPSTAKRRLMLMLQLLERSAGILKIGTGAKQRWQKWDEKALAKILELPNSLLKNNDRTILSDCSLSKPFLLLAGISGTGKTRFVREQAELTGSLADTYCLTSVRPDWHEPSDLLGYVSRLSGSAEFVVTDVLKFIGKAWREILDKGISLSVNEKLLYLQGGKSDIDAIKPYWLCLDEMNLAPVEQYFADYLSVIETRCWAWDEDDFQYSCDPLLKATTIQSIDNIEKLREELGFADANYDDAWQHICEYGLSIPFNLIVAGTVNMDETTHGFSRKVIDRALSFDFGDFFPNDFDNYFAPTTTNKVLSYPIYSDARTSSDKLPKIDIDGRKSIAFINVINNVLAHTPFKLAYRALNELLLAVISSEPKEEVDLKAVWDDFLMCKVLPRIEGDTGKLAAIGAVDISILKQLEEILESEFGSFWNELPGSGKARPDLYRENVDADKLIHIACRSKEKINWMEDRLTTFGFTSFWP